MTPTMSEQKLQGAVSNVLYLKYCVQSSKMEVQHFENGLKFIESKMDIIEQSSSAQTFQRPKKAQEAIAMCKGLKEEGNAFFK